MSKVRVQDATKELSASVGQLYDSVSKSRKRAQEALNALKKLEEFCMKGLKRDETVQN